MPTKHRQTIEADTSLNAVVVADAFDSRFMPLTADMPRCLLPLCNTPLIEYTLELLSVAGVQLVFLVCSSHTDMIREYIEKSRWSGETSAMKITIILTPDARSMGDVLRELDAKSILSEDFILVNGDVVSNMRLDKVLDAHRQRRKIDKNCIMTMVLKEASPFHRTRGEHALFYFDAVTQRCIQYHPIDNLLEEHFALLDLEILAQQKGAEVVIRNNLINCQIDICTIDVLALFSENFDYQDIRRDFVKGILESDLLGKTIYGHFINDEYATRIRNTQIYDYVSKDVIARWTFPLVPDVNFHNSNFTYYRNNVYRESPVLLSRSTQLLQDVVVGAHTSIGEHTVISSTVIGRNCIIGKNVRISNAYLWDSVTIDNDSIVENCIIASGVWVKENVTINRGCLIGQNVIIGPNLSVPSSTKLSRKNITYDDNYQSEEEEANVSVGDDEEEAFDFRLVGVEGAGYLYEAEVESDHDDNIDPVFDQMMNEIGYNSGDVRQKLEKTYREPPDPDSDDDESLEDNVEDYRSEIQATCERAFEENHTTENTIIELNTLKMACNLSFHDLRLDVVPAIMCHAFSTLPLSTNGVTARLRKWTVLLDSLTIKKQRARDELDITNLLGEWFIEYQKERQEPTLAKRYLAHVLKVLYDEDTISEDTLLVWWEQCDETILREGARPFIEWLKSAEEEDDDEEEEEEEEEE